MMCRKHAVCISAQDGYSLNTGTHIWGQMVQFSFCFETTKMPINGTIVFITDLYCSKGKKPPQPLITPLSLPL